ncbi:HtaA domain-containing protein [Brevibacterium ravenspurgense]|uniref:HtaA domain-containing protein n=1 Tax=Brevibacterium ravenspurgense TaxID=479117 RepID=UPI000AF464CB|nr:HtaA domain-containing protein [Brevibacterium ravenspurgense]
MVLTAALTVPVGPGAAFAESASEGSLDWGIRTSFNNYTGGPSEILGGAAESPTGFTFELVSQKYEAETNLTDLQFNGFVRYLQYCDIPTNPATGGCALDLRFEDPRVVISDSDSYLEATVYSKQYPSGEIWAPSEPVRVANLHTASATMDASDGRVKWSNIASTLTEDGNKMFSEFYSPGEALDPLSRLCR